MVKVVAGFGRQGRNHAPTLSRQQLQLVWGYYHIHGNERILIVEQGECVMMAGLCVFQPGAVKFMFS